MVQKPGNRYAQTIRRAWDDAHLTLRAAENLIGYSYEHIRLVLNGGLNVSREFNDKLCHLLGLDVNQMWSLLLEEKASVYYGDNPPGDVRLSIMWPRLNGDSQQRLLEFAHELTGKKVKA